MSFARKRYRYRVNIIRKQAKERSSFHPYNNQMDDDNTKDFVRLFFFCFVANLCSQTKETNCKTIDCIDS